MISTAVNHWREANRRYLLAALALVHGALARYIGSQDFRGQEKELQQALQEATAAMPAPSALDKLCQIFNLLPFERDVLLLCVGMELDTSFARLYATAQGDPQRAYPTFSLALAALPDTHWSALTPAAPLRRWQLIEVGQGYALTLSPLRIKERILHYIAGTPHLDEQLVGLVEPLQVVGDLVPSHQALAEQVVAVLSQTPGTPAPPIVQSCGSETVGKRVIAASACTMLGLNLHVIPAHGVPSGPSDLDNLSRLLARETLLSASAFLLDCNELDATDPIRTVAVARLIERTNNIRIVSSRDRIRFQRPTVSFDVHKPTSKEQQEVWQGVLAERIPQLNGQVRTLVAQFNLSASTIRAACSEVTGHLAQRQENDLGNILWDTCRVQARPRLDDLAQRIEPTANWQDLVLPEAQAKILHEVAVHVRQRATVYESWGFAAKGTRGLGISALFAGASGTGKTLAAEVLAHQLRLDLYRIDLSSVVSKYIGETEKNLRRVFDAAEAGGVILLFDEADALFGKRSEVKDSRDRYANIEVSYLLQRMECYPGLAILTTNLKSALDTAFLRRIRFVVQFLFPDAVQRAEIWRRIFPASTPTEGLDPAKLARLNVAGGNIRNIALNAAFLAADAREPVQMKHLLRAAQTEYAKLEKTLTESEISGWV